MDVTAFLEAYGLPGLIILGLGVAVIHLWRAFISSQENRIADARDAAREIRTIAEASNSALDSLQRVLERRGPYDPS
jgi:hypothetical protein